MIALALPQIVPSAIWHAVSNDRRSPYRFKVTNASWTEGKDNVLVEAFLGKRRLDLAVWPFGFPNVYDVKVRRVDASRDVLVSVTCDGTQTQYTGVWLFSAKTQHMTLLAKAICNADDSRLALGVVKEQGVGRWLFHPPRGDSPDGWFHRIWTYDRKIQRLIPGPWKRGC